MRWAEPRATMHWVTAGSSWQVGRSTLQDPGCRLRLLSRDLREVDPGFGARRIGARRIGAQIWPRSLLVLQEAPDPATRGQRFVSPPLKRSAQARALPFWIRMCAVSLRAAGPGEGRLRRGGLSPDR